MTPPTTPRAAPATDSRQAYERLMQPQLDGLSLSRRRFLGTSLAVGGAASVPGWLPDSALAAGPLGPGDRILVPVMLGGGIDYLNTLVPLDDGRYQSLRGSLAVPGSQTISLGGGKYVNNRLGRLAARYNAGHVAFVEGVGEPTNDHSHFSSMARWLAGRSSGPPSSGWLGRWMTGAGLDALGGVAIGDRGVPLHLQGATGGVTALPTNGGLYGGDRSEQWERDTQDAIIALGGDSIGVGPYGDLAAWSAGSALSLASRIEPLYENQPENGLVRDLALAADLINLDIGCRVISVSQDGYDTHDAQAVPFNELLVELDLAIDTFFSRLAPTLSSKVCMLLFSEFGRRPERNGSAGTDHGTAGMMVAIGNRVRGGFHGQAPSLGDLDRRRDLKFNLDFRAVYTDVLDNWLAGDSSSIIGQSYAGTDLFVRPGPGGFYDVDASAYYGPAVGWLAATGITGGTAPGQFSPDAPVTRAQMATFLWRLKGRQSAPASGFTDVPRGTWYTEAVDWLVTTGITTGTSPTQFSPDRVLTRGEMATLLWRMEGRQSAPRHSFSDVRRGTFYDAAVSWLAHTGVTTGVAPGRFGPSEPVNRGQMATFLWRLEGEPVV